MATRSVQQHRQRIMGEALDEYRAFIERNVRILIAAQDGHTHECRGCRETVSCNLDSDTCDRTSGFDGYCDRCA